MQLIQIVNGAYRFVAIYFKEKISPYLTFHNLNHTYEVFEAVKLIGLQTEISETDLHAVEVAALFHDCGYSEIYLGHEEVSKNIAESFLIDHNCSTEFIKSVAECIDATRFPHAPVNLKEKILCDADLFHFTKPNYLQYAAALKNEHEKYLNRSYSDYEWLEKNYQFLSNHKYFTDYGSNTLEPLKQINIDKLESQLGLGTNDESK